MCMCGRVNGSSSQENYHSAFYSVATTHFSQMFRRCSQMESGKILLASFYIASLVANEIIVEQFNIEIPLIREEHCDQRQALY